MANRSHIIFFMLSLVFISLCLSLCKGSTSISLYQLLFHQNSVFNDIFLKIRLPHTVAAFITGSLLGLAGAKMQLLLQNPLADPYVLGVSSGAAFFTLLGMLLGLDTAYLIGAGWIGSLLTIALIFFFAHKRSWQPHTLLLIGITLACGFSAGSSFILLVSPNEHLHHMLFWLTGDINTIGFPWVALIVLIIGASISFLLSPELNLLLRGEAGARVLGLRTERLRAALFILSALFTATAVSLGGSIGFIGLIIPHIARLLIKSDDQRYILPCALLLGGTLLTLADTIARTLFAPTQLPVGLVTTCLGVPVFIWLLQR